MDREAITAHAENFAALADETRLEVLVGIMEQVTHGGPVTYTEAWEAVDIEDSGHFNYHLGELTGNWLYPMDDQYLPTTAARELFRTLSTGRLRDNDLDRRSVPVDAACLRCGEFLHAVYDYEFFVLCDDCQRTPFLARAGPEAGGEADLVTLARDLAVVDRRQTKLLLDARCPDCAGTGTVEVGRTPELGWLPTEYYVYVGCSDCQHGYRVRTPGQYLLVAPEVQRYADAHGIDLSERPQWAYEWARSDYWTVVRSEDPLRLEQHATVDGCRLVVEFDADGTVAYVDHVPLDAPDADAVPPGATGDGGDASPDGRFAPDRAELDE